MSRDTSSLFFHIPTIIYNFAAEKEYRIHQIMEIYIIIAAALLLAAFFSGMEIAFVSSNKLLLEVESSDTSITRVIVRKFYQHPQQYITTMLLGGNIVLVVFSIKMDELLKPYFTSLGHPALSSLIVSVIATIIVLFFGEYIPKMLMRANPNAWLRAFSPILYTIYIIFYPFAAFCMWLSKGILRIVGVKVPKNQDVTFSRADLNYLVEEITVLEEAENGSSEEEAPSENEIQILKNALEFSKVKIRDCYVPRTDIIALPYEVSEEELKRTFDETGHSKIPIYKGDIDNIIGYIHCLELFQHRTTWRDHINQMPFVPENMAAEKLMRTFMQQKKSVAVVIDEFGGTAGIVTLEDIFEEIFGEIEDEHDVQEFTAKRLNDKEIVVNGRMEVEELNEEFGLELPEDEAYDTVVGLIFNQTGTFLNVNEEVTIGKYRLKCLKTVDNKIERIKIILE